MYRRPPQARPQAACSGVCVPVPKPERSSLASSTEGEAFSYTAAAMIQSNSEDYPGAYDGVFGVHPPYQAPSAGQPGNLPYRLGGVERCYFLQRIDEILGYSIKSFFSVQAAVISFPKIRCTLDLMSVDKVRGLGAMILLSSRANRGLLAMLLSQNDLSSSTCMQGGESSIGIVRQTTIMCPGSETTLIWYGNVWFQLSLDSRAAVLSSF